ncbi:MAG: DoxX family protein [Candidatus Acidiferrales bacterium]|jgi:putative oxidoreductase
MSKTENPILRLYDGFVKAVSSLQSPFLLLVRVYWGWQLSQNGWAKLHNLAHVTDFFSSLGLPAPHATAAFVSSFEFVCGILLALGLLTRIAALGLTIDMFTAYWTADHVALLSFVSDPDKFQNAASFVYLFVGLLILIFGAGKISLDHLLDRAVRKTLRGDSGSSLA